MNHRYVRVLSIVYYYYVTLSAAGYYKCSLWIIQISSPGAIEYYDIIPLEAPEKWVELNLIKKINFIGIRTADTLPQNNLVCIYIESIIIQSFHNFKILLHNL
jgi:hypothetical protein